MPSPTILPNSFAILLLPNKTSKLVRVTPNSTISLGKFGSFPTNSLLHRPYHLTYDIVDEPGQQQSTLALVSTEELTRDLLGEQEAEAAQEEDVEDGGAAVAAAIASEILLVDDSGLDDVRNNRETVDDPSTQKLSWAEIEELKKSSGGSGKEIISALMKSHANLHQKTAYSLGKYALRKRCKYLKRFTVKPVDVATLLDYLVSEKEASRVMEMRQEGLALMLSLGNVRYCPDVTVQYVDSAGELKEQVRRGGRWLVVDETGGLLVAAVAERLGLLDWEPAYLHDNEDAEAGYSEEEEEDGDNDDGPINEDEQQPPTKKAKISHTGAPQPTSTAATSTATKQKPQPTPRRRHPAPATSNTITLVHPNEQPNLSLLKHFQYDPNSPPTTHPLHTHLRTISYLSLLSPSSDPYLGAPERITDTVFRSYKSGKKSAYLRKWRRWERSARTVMETRSGGFDGLLVASWMDVKGLLAHLSPFVRGSGQIIVWRPDRESLVTVVDACGKEMKGEWLRRKDAELDALKKQAEAQAEGLASTAAAADFGGDVDVVDKELDPTILLAPTIHSTTVRTYQVLPGRTHPVMTSRGGAEGYVFCATRVLPVEGKVEARGKGMKKREKGGGR
ncbi:Gcd10p family-domain-containing protein [Peziza echinospora]|nr:Gcd10p family-domain-containing protein [Peziza echinospora]